MNKGENIHRVSHGKYSGILFKVLFSIFVLAGVNIVGAILGVTFYTWQSNLLGIFVASIIMTGAIILSVSIVHDAKRDGIVRFFSRVSATPDIEEE